MGNETQVRPLTKSKKDKRKKNLRTRCTSSCCREFCKADCGRVGTEDGIHVFLRLFKQPCQGGRDVSCQQMKTHEESVANDP